MTAKILWADDEIDLLKPYMIFLNQKGYEVVPVISGIDALEKLDEAVFDLVFLDENMPGMTGLETLLKIKQKNPHIPIVMITKNEEEHIMEEAIGSKISDYLIKPINPNQVLLSIKKILDNKRLVENHTNQKYQQNFSELSMILSDKLDWNEWIDVYKKLIFWELEIDRTENKSMKEIIFHQKSEANNYFSKFIKRNYQEAIQNQSKGTITFSPQVLSKYVFPQLSEDIPTFLVVIDNLRFDQWKILEPIFKQYFNIKSEDVYFSILPTTTTYARNSLFSGMMPFELDKKYPELNITDEDEGGRNNHEETFLKAYLERYNKNFKASYHKIIHQDQGKQLVQQLNTLWKNQLNAIVFNFVDMLSHSRTDMAMVKELIPDESAYRTITKSWFEHSYFIDFIRKIADKKCKLVITTDHGTICVKKPSKVVGPKELNSNLRYKFGKSFDYNSKEVYEEISPENIGLPKKNISTRYIFALEDNFFVYPNNYNYYVNMFNNTFQHGGISLEEMIVPIVVMSNK